MLLCVPLTRLQIGRLLHKACCSVRAGMAPDEFIIITALKQLRLVRSVQRVEVKPHMRYPPGTLLNSYPTFVVFPAVSSPHPVLWTHLDKKVRCQVSREGRASELPQVAGGRQGKAMMIRGTGRRCGVSVCV